MSEHDHMCAWSCGNVADNVLVNLNTSEADILCTPCFLRLANDISEAWVKSMEEQGFMDPKDHVPSAGTTEGLAETLTGVSGAVDSGSSETLSDSAETGSGETGSSGPLADDPPEYEPSLDNNFGNELPYESEPACPVCDGVGEHSTACMFS